MRDNEIISLFEMRDEHAIEVLSDKYHPYCTRSPGICLQTEKIRRNA